MDQSRLKQLLSYDAKTGEFRRIAKVKGVVVGSVAGCLMKHGYVSIGIDGGEYTAHTAYMDAKRRLHEGCAK